MVCVYFIEQRGEQAALILYFERRSPLNELTTANVLVMSTGEKQQQHLTSVDSSTTMPLHNVEHTSPSLERMPSSEVCSLYC
jgi:hypothetical protein